ncbi:hypothetical protein WOLCODRAFT_149618 [Wolfiporia cocos MD-104 SS10]|uniref:Uncharacterized protein n=1 Tax=Wolfiporia cocos (strain MD-104) TaxID=742152 RepID=A0A2H3J8U3_WOLCO|nr:hypothetical protein WOLCODRAFT_149618 [Wolfiporia cocos MD-104 SS10]
MSQRRQVQSHYAPHKRHRSQDNTLRQRDTALRKAPPECRRRKKEESAEHVFGH